MEIFSFDKGHNHGIKLYFTFKRRVDYSSGDHFSSHDLTCDFFPLRFCGYLIQDLVDGSVLLRLANLYEVNPTNRVTFSPFIISSQI